MRIVIDLHWVQSEYSDHQPDKAISSLVEEFIRNRGDHEVFLVLNGTNPEQIAPTRVAFSCLVPSGNIRVWHPPESGATTKATTQWLSEVSSIIRHACLLQLEPDIVFMPFNLHGFYLRTVHPVQIFHPNLRTVIALEESTGKARVEISTSPPVKDLTHLKGADIILIPPSMTAKNIHMRSGAPLETIKAALPNASPNPVRAGKHPCATSISSLLEELKQSAIRPLIQAGTVRPKLAYVSPLPPEQSGISDYSAELLPELSRFYDIDVIIDQNRITTPWIHAQCGIRRVHWFLKNKASYDRIIYHFGNSPYHQHMFKMLDAAPGVTVLHDFYLGNIQAYREDQKPRTRAWTRALYLSHGWGPAAERFNPALFHDIQKQYPANLETIEKALGVIVHSNHSKSLAQQWYGSAYVQNWAMIPLMRAPRESCTRDKAKEALGIQADTFLVCTFGLLGPTKLTHSILDAWLASELDKNPNCLLIFVGESPPTEYNTQLLEKIQASSRDKTIQVTGWVDQKTYQRYLSSADLAIQFRTNSRGETSAAVLDTLNFSIPTIVNAHGSMAELPSDSVWMLPDSFEQEQVVDALNHLWLDKANRDALGEMGKKVIDTHHLPQSCGERYFQHIERFYSTAQSHAIQAAASIAAIMPPISCDPMRIELSRAIARSTPPVQPTRQLLIDVSATCQNDLKTGIQRVVRALVWELIQAPPPGFRIEPIYLSNKGKRWHYRYARKWTAKALGIVDHWVDDTAVDFFPGDQLLVADFTGAFAVEAKKAGLLQQLTHDGVELIFVVYDLLPAQMPDFFPPGQFAFLDWLTVVTHMADKAICISKTVALDLEKWVARTKPKRAMPLDIGWFHLGADVENSVPTSGLPTHSRNVLPRMKGRPSFLMVGTLEPRKGHGQTLAAFSQLWAAGQDLNLVILGNEGWKGLADSERRTIPEITKALRAHPEAGKRLFWVEDASDEYLAAIYAASTCLLAPAEGEGFGLPLIEAAQKGLPIIARDIPVFREVAGENASYFSGGKVEDLSETIRLWISSWEKGEHRKSGELKWLTWKQSAAMLLSNLKIL